MERIELRAEPHTERANGARLDASSMAGMVARRLGEGRTENEISRFIKQE